MTKIYIYCLFDTLDNFLGVYSSLKAIHRDAIKMCNRGSTSVMMLDAGAYFTPSLTRLRNTFKGKCDYGIRYMSDGGTAQIYKTKLKE